MATYDDMIAEIASELKRADLTADVRVKIKEAVEHYEDQHFYFNEEVELTLTATVSTQYLDLPSNWEELITVSLNTNNYTYQLRQEQWPYLDSIATNDAWEGRPEIFALMNDQMRLYPIPNETYTLNLTYVKNLGDITTSTSTAWFNTAKQLIKYRAKATMLEDVIRGPEAQQEASTYRAREQEQLDRLERKTTRRRASGRLRPYV